MSGHGYETGRLNLPFVGLCSFGKYPTSQIGQLSMLILLF